MANSFLVLYVSFQSQDYTGKMDHPCYPSDFINSFRLKEVFDSPCTASWRPKPYSPHSHITVQGTGDYQSCLGNTSKIFSFKSCSFSQCAFNGVFQPNISGGFMVRGIQMAFYRILTEPILCNFSFFQAFSAYFFTHSFLQQITGMKISTSAQLEEATQAVCNMTIGEV